MKKKLMLSGVFFIILCLPSCGTIGGAICPIIAGLIFDRSGSYDLAFLGLAIFASIGLIMSLLLPSYREKSLHKTTNI